MNNKSKVIGIILGIIGFIVLVSGITYAWLSYRSSSINIVGGSECFDINYTVSRNIGTLQEPATLRFFTSYNRDNMNQVVANPLYAEVALSIDSNCNMTGTGTIYLTTDSTGTSSAILSGGLYYTLTSVTNNVETVISSGAITSTDLALKNNINVTTTSGSTVYRVYVWINGTVADNSYANTTYVGTIRAEVQSNG